MQKAIFAKLSGDAAVIAAMGGAARVYDKVNKAEDQLTYPLIRIGDDQVLGASNGCFDAWDVAVTLSIFSRDIKAPRVEAKTIANAVVGALMDEASWPAPVGFKIAFAELEQTRTFMDQDGITGHGVVVINYRVNDDA